MERKKGEIFEYNGEWYQCVEGKDCANCVFIDYCKSHSKEERDSAIGLCVSFDRNDGMHVIFKKLEKIGEPYMLEDKKFQKYKVFKTPYIYHKIDCSWQSFAYPYYISLEIKENMEEKKIQHYNCFFDKKEKGKLNLKPFDLKAAKLGKPVCTRDGRNARIICFDLKNDEYPIVAAVGNDSSETLFSYTTNGEIANGIESDKDLMMLPEKKEGWVNLYKSSAHSTKEEAMKYRNKCNDYIDTIKIEWEE